MKRSDRVGFVYVLHFHDAYYHAQHYVGSTLRPKLRCIRHASGRGARLLEVVMQAGGSFSLAYLGACPASKMKAYERELKAQHSAKRYCKFCAKQPKRVNGTTPYPFEFDSRSFTTDQE